MGMFNRPQGWNGAPQGGGGGWQTVGGDPYQGSQQFQTFQQNGMDRQAEEQARMANQKPYWGFDLSKLPPHMQPGGGGGGPQVRGGGQQGGYPGQWGGGQGGMGGGQIAGLMQQMYSPSGQGGGSQAYGGWGGLQTNQRWR